jgi:hypothetical protein
VNSLMAAVQVGISHGRADQGSGREDGTLHGGRRFQTFTLV